MTDPDRRAFLTSAAGAVAAFSVLPQAGLASWVRQGDAVTAAVIGAGRQGRAILAELQKWDTVTVAAICDTDPGRLRSGLRRARGATGYATHAELLEKEPRVNAVFIATPTQAHRQVAVDALAAGRNVYCEAPVASTAEDALAIVAAARAGKTVFRPGLQARSNPIYALARSFFRTDAVRTPVILRAQHHRKTSWRVPAPDPSREKALNWRLDPAVSLGLPGEWGTHQFDVASWFLERYPASVRGTGAIRFYDDGRTVPDTVTCEFTYDDGLDLLWDGTLANSYGGTFELLCGTNATIKLAETAGWMFKEADAPQQGWEVYANRQQFHNDEGITLIADATQLASQGKLKEGVGLPNPPLYYALEDFLEAVSTGSTPDCSAEAGYRATIVGIAAHEAVTSGKEIAITDAMLKAE